MSKISIFSGIAFFVAFAAVVQAGYEYSLEFSTADNGWQFANVTPNGYVNPQKNNSQITNSNTWTKWYGTNGTADPAIEWINTAKLNGAFTDVVVNPSKGTNWAEGDDIAWISPTKADKSKTVNGYYAYELTLYSAQAALLNGTLNFTYASDDYLAAIYLNGQRIYGNTGFNLTGSESEQWTAFTNLSLSGIELFAGENDFVFLVHNTNAAGSDSPNATGLAVKGTFESDVKLSTTRPPHQDAPAVTPEPATALILLGGLIGLPFLRRKSK